MFACTACVTAVKQAATVELRVEVSPVIFVDTPSIRTIIEGWSTGTVDFAVYDETQFNQVGISRVLADDVPLYGVGAILKDGSSLCPDHA